jgi:hypothetical protein
MTVVVPVAEPTPARETVDGGVSDDFDDHPLPAKFVVPLLIKQPSETESEGSINRGEMMLTPHSIPQKQRELFVKNLRSNNFEAAIHGMDIFVSICNYRTKCGPFGGTNPFLSTLYLSRASRRFNPSRHRTNSWKTTRASS